MKPDLKLIQGTGTGGDAEQMKLLGKRLMPALIDPATRLVRFDSIAEVEQFLQTFGVKRTSQSVYPPNSQGQMIFFQKDRVLVRIKTIGESQGRRNKAHLSASMMNGKGIAWQDEQAKFNYRGDLVPKSITTAENFQKSWKPNAQGEMGYFDFEKNPHRFVVIIEQDPGGKVGDRWADETHFFFRSAVLA